MTTRNLLANLMMTSLSRTPLRMVRHDASVDMRTGLTYSQTNYKPIAAQTRSLVTLKTVMFLFRLLRARQTRRALPTTTHLTFLLHGDHLPLRHYTQHKTNTITA